MRRTPLTDEQLHGPFIPRLSGITPKRARASDLDKSVYGVRLAGTAADLRARCEMVALRLHDSIFFSHTTTALLLGAPLPFAHERDAAIHVSVDGPLPPPHARGIRGHHLDIIDGDLVRWRGLWITSAARTWCDVAAVLRLEDLVAVGDYFIHHDSPLTSREEIRHRLSAFAGHRGVRIAREAVDLLADRSESRPESWVRVIAIRGGLPDPEINYTVVDSETGQQVRPDFLFRAQKLILEYQGDYHRTRKQWRKDMTRRARLEAAGWYVMEFKWDDVQNPEELVVRIRSVHLHRG